MKIKKKNWLWNLTWPFANDNHTTVGHTIYYPKGFPPNKGIIHHEEIHERQWMKEGFVKFYFLYLFCLPILWNPWRYKWEREAGTRIEELRSYKYGWLS
jgi:hypothetical protein